VSPFAAQLSFQHQVKHHSVVTSAVHAEGGKIAMQILHAGRYAYHPLSVRQTFSNVLDFAHENFAELFYFEQVAPSRLQAPISPFTPIGLPSWAVEMTISDFATCAQLAQEAGYDGVEVCSCSNNVEAT
jgi:2,4-dienoyl-CoA reductase (NADPH2)